MSSQQKQLTTSCCISNFHMPYPKGMYSKGERKCLKKYDHAQLGLGYREVPIRYHILVQGHRSPYDGNAFYWSSRLGRYLLIYRSLANLIKKQKGYCPICGRFFVLGDSLYVIRRTGCSEDITSKEVLLIHKYCQ